MWIKLCGIKYLDNYNDLPFDHIDAVGFNFYAKSPRLVEPDLKDRKPFEGIKSIGVFVNASPTFIMNQVKIYRLDMVQLHGDESPEFCDTLMKEIPVIKALGVSSPTDVDLAHNYQNCSMVLFDTKSEYYGGTGVPFKWSLLQQYQGDLEFLLAGGIGPHLGAGLKQFRHPKFKGVDINSKFEYPESILKDMLSVKKFSQTIKS